MAVNEHGENTEEELLAGMMSPSTIYDSSGDEHEGGRSSASDFDASSSRGGENRSSCREEGVLGLPRTALGADRSATALLDAVSMRLKPPSMATWEENITSSTSRGDVRDKTNLQDGCSDNPATVLPAPRHEGQTLPLLTASTALKPEGGEASSLGTRPVNDGGSEALDPDCDLLDRSFMSPSSSSICMRDVSVEEETGGASYRRTVSGALACL